MDPVKLEALEAMIAAPPSTGEHEDGLLVREWEEQWIYRLPATLEQALIELPSEEIPRLAREWAATEEMRLDGVDPTNDDTVAGVAAYIGGLRALAWQARQDGKDLYLWMSL